MLLLTYSPTPAPMQLWEEHLALTRSLVNRFRRRWRWIDHRDLEQSAYLALWRVVLAYERAVSSGRPFFSYVIRAVTNALLVEVYSHHPMGKNASMSLRRNGNQILFLHSDEDTPILENLPSRALPEAADIEDRELAEKALGYLSGIGKEVIRLHFVEGVSYSEIGKRYGYGKKWACTTCQKALKRMRFILGVTTPDANAPDGRNTVWTKKRLLRVWNDQQSGVSVQGLRDRYGLTRQRAFNVAYRARKEAARMGLTKDKRESESI